MNRWTADATVAPLNPAQTPEEWRLSALIAKGANGQIHIERMTITPEMARVMMKHNTGNRPIRARTVAVLVDIIRSGRWVTMLQGISFAPDGTMNNGQHRLLAIIESGRTVEMIVAFGEPREAFAIIDTQSKRAGSDILSIDGHKNAVALAATCQMLHQIERGTPRSNNQETRLTNDRLLSFLDVHPTLPTSVAKGQATAQSLRCSVAALSVAHYLGARQNATAADAFLSGLRAGVGLLSESDPIYRLRERLRMGRLIPIEQCALAIKAWNAWRAGKPLWQLGWRRDEAFPEAL